MGWGYIAYDLLRDSSRAAARAGSSSDISETVALATGVAGVAMWFAGAWAAVEALDGRWGTTAELVAWAFIAASPMLVFTRRLGPFVAGMWAMYLFWIFGYWNAIRFLGEKYDDRLFPDDMAASVDAFVVGGLASIGALILGIFALAVPTIASMSLATLPRAAITGLTSMRNSRVASVAESSRQQHDGSPTNAPPQRKAVDEILGTAEIPREPKPERRPAAPRDSSRHELTAGETLMVVLTLVGLGCSIWVGVSNRSLWDGLATIFVWLAIQAAGSALTSLVRRYRRKY